MQFKILQIFCFFDQKKFSNSKRAKKKTKSK